MLAEPAVWPQVPHRSVVDLYNTNTRFGLVSKLLHWLIAIGIAGLIWLGWWMVGLSYYDPWYNAGLELHKAFGLIVLALVFAKFSWQIANRPPGPSAHAKPWERTASGAMHWVLYAVMFALPVTGYVITTAAGQGVSVFGLFDVPAILPESETLRDTATAIHYYVSYGAIALILGHAGAALKHHFVDKDDTLIRMTWGKFKKP